jgi:aryl-alcohol dehydrogenase-like predicted oxidoreductase
MTGMRRVVDAGVVRHAGVSNYSLERWTGAERAFGGPILSNQVSFSLIERGPLKHLVPFAQEHGRVVIAYSPLAQGVLGGKYDVQTRPVGVARRMNPLFLPENLERAEPLIDALREIAKSHQAKPAQIALAWLIRKPNVVAIPGASSVEQLESNAAAADVELTDAQDAQLLEAAERFEPVGGVERARGLAESLVGSVRERLGLGGS